MFIAEKQILIKIYNHVILRFLFPKRKLLKLVKHQIKLLENFRHGEVKILPYQSTYKCQKVF